MAAQVLIRRRSRAFVAAAQSLVLAMSLAGTAVVFQASAARAAISVASDAGVWGVDGRIRAMVRVGDTVYLGGKFSNAVSPDGSTTVARHNLAAIDVTTGQLLPWAPSAENPGGSGKAAAGAVFGMETDGTQVFVAGDFTTITWTDTDGVTQTTTPRTRFAAIAPDQYGSLLALQADADLRERALALSGTTLYIGGEFAHMDGQPRTRLAAIDLSSNPPGALLPWAPAANGAVVTMGAPSNGNIMIGGNFSAVNGDTAQAHLAAIDPSGVPAPWNVHPTAKVLSLVAQGANVYAGIGGNGNAVDAFDGLGNLLWSRGTDGDVQAVGFCQDQVIAGGHFGKIGPNNIPKLAALDVVTGKVDTTWQPQPHGGTWGVWSLLGTPTKLFVGGDFTSVGGQSAIRFAQFSTGPAIIGVSPTSGPEGTTVQISGKSLLDATQVDFNGMPATFVVDSDISITTTVPAGATTGPIHVTTPEGTATGAQTFTVLPTISGFSPASSPVGSSVTITGTHLGGATKVKFGGYPALAFTVDSPTQVTAQVPPSAATGPIKVTTPDGDATSFNSFFVTPTITGLTPTSARAGDAVTITGTSFLGATDVSFNGVAASFVVNSRTQISATVPAGATTGPVSVTTPGGTAVSPMQFSVGPAITGSSPTSGAEGTTVQISGKNFLDATQVDFNGVSAGFVVDSDISITTTVPAGATTGPIHVTTPEGTATGAQTFTVLPTISGFSPASSPVGSSVTITGTHLGGATKVKFGGYPALAFTVDSPTQVTAQVPPSATTGAITVTTPDGDVTSSTTFTVTPAITDLSPKSAHVGDSVTITGTSFLGATDVSFNGVAASFVVNSRTQVVATVPAGATTGPVSLTTPDGTAVSPMSLKLLPTITGFSPMTGPVGTIVTISGYNFTGATKVKFAGTNAIFTVDTDQQITATVPLGAISGSITVVTPTASATSADSFTVA